MSCEMLHNIVLLCSRVVYVSCYIGFILSCSECVMWCVWALVADCVVSCVCFVAMGWVLGTKYGLLWIKNIMRVMLFTN